MKIQPLLSSTLFITLVLCSQTSLAATYLGEEMLSVQSPIGDDTYAGGGKVIFADAVNGDLIVGGGDILINGVIAEDLIAAGGNIRVRGNIGDDVRIAGGDVEISGNVNGDLIVFGGRVEVLDNVRVAGDIVINGGEVTMNGNVLGNSIVNAGVLFMGGQSRALTFRGEELYLSGTVTGNLKSVTKNVVLGDEARINGNVEYWSKNADLDFESITTGTVTINDELRPMTKHPNKKPAVMSLLTTLLIILIAVFATRTYFKDGVTVLKKEPWMNALYGLLYFVATPIIAALFMISLIGLPVGIIIMMLYVITVMVAKPMTAILLTKYWESRRPKKAKALGQWQIIFLSLGVYIVMKLLGLVPILGSLLVAFAVCGAYGALMRVEYKKYLKVR